MENYITVLSQTDLTESIFSSPFISLMYKLFSIKLLPVSWTIKPSTSFLLTWYLSPVIEGPMAIIKLFFLEPIPSNLFKVFEIICFLIPFSPAWQAAMFLVFMSAISIGIQSAVYIHKLCCRSLDIKASPILGFKFIPLFTSIILSLCTCCA